MRNLLASAVAIALAAPALAQELPTNAKVSTGYQVQGCTWYQMVDGRVVQTCRRDAFELASDNAGPGVNDGGDAGASGGGSAGGDGGAGDGGASK